MTKNKEELDSDILSKEFKKNYDQFQNDFVGYMCDYVIPDVVAYQLAQAHYRNCLTKTSFKRHYTSMSDVINIFPSFEDTKHKIIKILKIKYNLTIYNEDPLILGKWR